MTVYLLVGGIEMMTSKQWTWTAHFKPYAGWHLLPSIMIHWPNSWLYWFHLEFAFLCFDFVIEKRYPRK